MADPLSLTASIIAVAGVVQTVAQGIRRIVALRHAPEQILQLSDEVSELGTLLMIAEKAAQESSITDSASIRHFQHLLDRARHLMQELFDLIRLRLLKDPGSLEDDSKKIEVRWSVWIREESRIRTLAASLSEVRQRIAAALAALSAFEIPKVRVSLQSIALVSKDMRASIRRLENVTTQRLDNLQASIMPYSRGLVAINDIERSVQLPSMPTQRLQPDRIESGMKSTQEKADPGIQVEGITEFSSMHITLCSCSCHSTLALKTPQWLGAAIGTLLVRYTRASFEPCQSCGQKPCGGGSNSTFKTHYYFPAWLLRQMMCVQLSWNSLNGHSVSLKTSRIISSNSNIFLFAQHGNIEGIKRLFEQKLASPFDISLEEGRSALHFAVTATQPKMVSFLLEHGADPCLEDHNMLSAHDVVWNYLLQMPGSAELETLLWSTGLSVNDTDSLEKRNFTPLHRIVLGLSSVRLDAYLDMTTSEIDKRDLLGKTPLCWAASRPDSRAVETLLRYGASPSLADHRKQTPLHYCAGSGTPQSMELVLKAAMNKAHQQASTWREGNRPDDFSDQPDFLGHIVDTRDSKGRTPLNFATRMDFPEHTQLLISYGADMECIDAVLDRTTLLCAIYWQSHKVLPILLESGACTDIVDSRHASILHYAARFGDLKALDILSKYDLGQLDINSRDDSGHIPWEIFASRHERCITEDEDTREKSVKLFSQILENATKHITRPAHVCQEIEDDQNDSPSEKEAFYDAFSDPPAPDLQISQFEATAFQVSKL